jgi:hypothetical protein
MTVLSYSRYVVEPENADDHVVRRAALITAVRAEVPGLGPTRVARVDERTWLDVWLWESRESVEAARAYAPTLPEAAAAFALLGEHRLEFADVVDEV